MLCSLVLALSPSYVPAYLSGGFDLTLSFTVPALPNELAGSAVRAAGDVNGDGVADILTYSIESTGSGAVRIRSGSDRALLRTLPLVEYAFWAVPMAAAGDLNGDGFSDVLVGDAGQKLAFVYSGATGATLFTLAGLGASPNEGFGRVASAVGDVDGDGTSDLAVSALDATGGHGYVRVFSGALGAALYDIAGVTATGRFGASVAGIGDLDGDGLSDIAVGATSDGNRFLNPGAPPFVPPFWTVDGAGAVYTFSGATGAPIWVATGDLPGAGLGYRVAGAGDVNGDGRPDVIVGSNSIDFPHEGYARVFSGADGSVLYTFLRGAQSARMLVSVDGGTDLDGDGVPDLLVGAVVAGAPSEPDVTVFSGVTGLPLETVSVIANHLAASGGVRDVAFGRAGQDDVLVAATASAFGAGLVLGYDAPRLGTPYCVSAVNSTGFGARLRAHGSLSVAANDLCFIASPLPQGFGFIAYGASPQQQPFGNGFLCVTGAITRLAATTVVGGALTYTLDLAAPPAPGAAIQPGSTWRFQAWYRDAFAGGALFNLSDGLELSFLP